MPDKAASALNQLCEDAFTAALSAGDRDLLFIADYFCSADAKNCSDDELEEELGDKGMQQLFIITTK